MRWLLRKDLRILSRSRLLVAVLVLYPVAIALLIGLALSRGPSRPRVAIVDETPRGETVQLGGRRVEVDRYVRDLFAQVDAIEVRSRRAALAKVSSGAAVAAVVIPSDIAARVGSGTEQGSLELIYDGDALEQSLVSSQLNAALAQANLGFSRQIQQGASEALEALLHGGTLGSIGAPANLIGLEQIPALMRRVIAHTKPGSDRAALERVATFADFAAANLTLSKRVLATVGQPIAVRSRLLHGRRTPLDSFAVVVAVTVSLMFLAVLLAAGGVALERQENALARLIRGLVSPAALLAEKGLLAALCASVVALALLCGVGAFVSLDWGRVGLWLLAIACGAIGFAALGVAIGALAKEVQAASLLAFLASLPIAFLALVPAGAVAHGFYEAIAVVSFLFPFKPALQALDAAVNSSSPALWGSLLHLLGLSVVFGAIGRFSLTRA